MSKNNFRVCEEVQRNRFSFADGRRGGGGGQKNASIFVLSGHERLEKRFDQ